MTAWEQKQFNLWVLKKCRLSLWASFSLVLALIVVKLVVSNRFATAGKRVEIIKAETAAVRQENDRLRLELAKNSGGLERLQEQAREQGFVDRPQYLYLTDRETVAQKQP